MFKNTVNGIKKAGCTKATYQSGNKATSVKTEVGYLRTQLGYWALYRACYHQGTYLMLCRKRGKALVGTLHAVWTKGRYLTGVVVLLAGCAQSKPPEEPDQPAPAGDAPTIVSLTFDPEDPPKEEYVRFLPQVAGTPPYSYLWDFEDGQTSQEAMPYRSFSGWDSDSAIVQLQVSNAWGADTMNVVVKFGLPYFCMELVELNYIFFDHNLTKLSGDAEQLLEENAMLLGECPNVQVVIQGYATLKERDPYGLATARAQAVMNYYVDRGVAPKRFEVQGELQRDQPARYSRRVESVISAH